MEILNDEKTYEPQFLGILTGEPTPARMLSHRRECFLTGENPLLLLFSKNIET